MRRSPREAKVEHGIAPDLRGRPKLGTPREMIREAWARLADWERQEFLQEIGARRVDAKASRGSGP
jgi:hypothetical protein